MEKLRIGIIGCGGVANGKHMPALKKIPEVEMVAFCDLIIERAQAAKAKYGTEDAKVCTDYHEILQDKSIDVVHVLTQNRWHATIAIDALAAGKHVMCEKPMAKTAAEAKMMLDAAIKSDKKLTIGYQNRQRKAIQSAKQICDDGELGDIYFARVHATRRRGVPTWGVFMNEFEQGGGPLIDIGSHSLDLCLYLMNNYEVASVTGSTFHKLSKTEKAANAWGPWDPKGFTVEDSAFGFIKMKNGAVIELESSWALNIPDARTVCVCLAGDKAGLDLYDGLRVNGEEDSRLYIKTIDLTTKGVDFFSGLADAGAKELEARQWIDSILYDKDPCVLPSQAYVVSQIIDAIYESAKTGKTVYF